MRKPEFDVLVDPEFGAEARDVDDFFHEFGPFNGRYVPRYPVNWKQRLRSHVDSLGLKPVARKRFVEELLPHTDLCTLPVKWSWDEASTWGRNAQALEEKAPAIVVGGAFDPDPFVAWEEALYDIRKTRQRSWPFAGTTSAYVDFCRPLLTNSPAAYLVDPYLMPFEDNGEILLRRLLDIAGRSSCYAIHMIVSREKIFNEERWQNQTRPKTLEQMRALLIQRFKDAVPKSRQLILHLVSDGPFGGELLHTHDRFFLTRHGAISFGQGFAIPNKQPDIPNASSPRLHQQNAFIVERDHHALLKKTYIDGVTRFRDLPLVAGVAYPTDVVPMVVG